MRDESATIVKRLHATPLRLVPVMGPRVEVASLDGIQDVLIGKDAECALRLEHPAISRRHAVLEVRSGQWFLTDVGSRNGTFVNGQRLIAESAVPIAHGDHIRFSPWVFRCSLTPTRTDTLTTEDHGEAAARIEPLPSAPSHHARVPSIAQSHLDGLIRASAAIYSSADERSLWDALLAAALALTGFQRGAIIRPPAQAAGENDGVAVEVRSQRHRDGSTDSFEFSRTLVQAASGGNAVHLRGDERSVASHSLMSMKVSEAVCLPLAVDGAVWGCLYLDSRGGPAVVAEAAQLCRMLGDIGSLALANVLRRDMEARFAILRGEAELAAQAQRLLLPPDEGETGGLRWAIRFRPGRVVSGDIVGIVELDSARTAAFVGDVTGKGFGAGLVMTAIQSYLSASLLRPPHRGDPAEVLTELNAHLMTRLPPGCYASLWLGIFDARENSVRIADAGHGLAILIRDGRPQRLEVPNGTWLGVEADAPARAYTSEAVILRPGDRIVVCSDGVAEQPPPSGTQGATGRSGEFGMARMMQALDQSTSVLEDVNRLLAEIVRYAGGTSFRDDLTIAAFTLKS